MLPALFLVLFLAASGPGTARAASQAFFDTWSDGKGEVDTYDLTEERYGEPRTGNAVMVFVAEELNRNDYVKVESEQTPQSERMFVIKLNKLYRFPTGIYDYSVMTTVFSVADSHLGHHRFQAARLVNTTQEWCGQVFQRVDLHEDGWHHELRSYFEKEADQENVVEATGTDVEDNLWVWIRELDGEVLAEGESRPLQLIPSLWELRKTHTKIAARDARISKGRREKFRTPLGEFDAIPWSWQIEDRTVAVWVEASGAHRILGWEDSQGGHARLVASVRTPYWVAHGNADLEWRTRLALPSESVLETP
ncbi:MAG: hypothetical protein KC729_11095 [Candidatus Eisenbacteria bacterium]|uniref:Uncharacterized protein n=1 Tax=Eiseniibacteriota bacterium TaxID=2212470 RepID=A0A956LYQ3_UNCEI|nr:hypothetical protein [Candidatus Eisenbacteria bacterium]